MLSGTVRGTNIPLASVHARLFVGREALSNGDPAPHFLVIQALNAAASVLALLVVVRMRLQLDPDWQRAWLLDASQGLALTLLLAPMAWQHYASWLFIAFLVLAWSRVWRPLQGAARAWCAALASSGFLLLSLNDDKLLHLLEPLVERWPVSLSFYAPGLLCVAAALAIARLAVTTPPAAVEAAA